MAITASQVKELRERTQAGMMDCKKALTACDGDMDKAIDWLRENGLAKSAKKAGRTAAEGLSKILIEGNKAAVIELNSETDFAAKNELFLKTLNNMAAAILAASPATLEDARNASFDGKTVAEMEIEATATIGEKISFRRFEIVEKGEDETFGAYTHQGGKIVALTVIKGSDAQVAKNIAMQVCSMAPKYVSREDVPAEEVEHEREVQTAIVRGDSSYASKPEKVILGAIEGKISKTFKDICLVDQEYFLDSKKKVGAYLKENNTSCVKFVRFVTGEGIEKKQENFAEEVAAQINK